MPSFLKLRNEITRRAESRIQRDLTDALGCGDQEFFRFRKSYIKKIIREGLSYSMTEEPGEIAVAHIAHLRHLLGQYRLLIILVNIIQNSI